MNIEKSRAKIRSLSKGDLDTLYTLVKEEYRARGDESHGVPVLSYTSNTTHTVQEQTEGIHRMFDRAWIHGY